MAGLDVLRGGDPPRSRRRRWPWVLLVVLVAAALGLRWADGVVAEREYDALLRAWTTAQGHTAYAERSVASIVEYASPQLQTAPADVRAGLRELVEQAAAKQLPVLHESIGAVTRVGVLPWHHALQEARAACAAYLDGRVHRLEAVALNALALGQPAVAFDADLAETLALLHDAAP
ncbi:MAG TPA: hypothetical protein VLC50_02850 [Actinomycetes bacterium]|nr:hypothetical protein [Actinomycetes bacterium]